MIKFSLLAFILMSVSVFVHGQKKDLGSGYSLDSGYVYYKDSVISGADVTTFKVLKGSDGMSTTWAKDKDKLYNIGLRNPEQIDFKGDLLSLSVIISNGNYTYLKDNHNVYFSWGTRLENIEGMDSNSFVYLGGLFSRDLKNVYSQDSIIMGADVNTFLVLVTPQGFTTWWAKDKNGLFLCAEFCDRIEFPGDLESFEVLEASFYGLDFARDKDCGYIYDYRNGWKTIPGSDGATFEYLGCQFTKDKHGVYVGFNKVEPAISDRFKGLGACFFSDSIHNYYGGMVDAFYNDAIDYIKINVPYNQLKIYGNGYFGDSTTVYRVYDHYENPLDSSQTELQLEFRIKTIDSADPQTFRYVGCDYTKDKRYVYFDDEIVVDADPVTFTGASDIYCVCGFHMGKDDYFYFMNGEKTTYEMNPEYFPCE